MQKMRILAPPPTFCHKFFIQKFFFCMEVSHSIRPPEKLDVISERPRKMLLPKKVSVNNMRNENYSAQMNLNTIFPFSIIVYVRPSLNKTWRVCWYGCYFLFISGKLRHVFIGSWKLNSWDFDALLFSFVYLLNLIRIVRILENNVHEVRGITGVAIKFSRR